MQALLGCNQPLFDPATRRDFESDIIKQSQTLCGAASFSLRLAACTFACHPAITNGEPRQTSKTFEIHLLTASTRVQIGKEISQRVPASTNAHNNVVPQHSVSSMSNPHVSLPLSEPHKNDPIAFSDVKLAVAQLHNLNQNSETCAR